MEKWYIDGYPLCTKAWNVERVLGGDGIPEQRGSNLQLPFAPGNMWIPKVRGSKRLMLGMWVAGVDPETGDIPTDKSMAAQLQINQDNLMRILVSSKRPTLSRVMRDGSIREAEVDVVGGIDFVNEGIGAAKFVLELDIANGTFQTPETITFERDAPASFELDYKGTAITNNIYIIVRGPIEKPRITNETANVWVEYNGPVEAGAAVHFNVIDFHSVYKGVKSIQAVKHGGDAFWMQIHPGVNRFKVEGKGKGKIEIMYKEKFY